MLTWCTVHWPWLKYTVESCWKPGLSERWMPGGEAGSEDASNTKSCLTVQRPSGYATFHFILLIFHILAPTMLWPNASAQVAGIWMRVHIYPFTWMSVGSSSKQCTSPLRNLTSAHLTGPRASLLERGGGIEMQHKIHRKILQTGALG